ncbi:MAG: polyphosphate polymerase domain-containing protein [Bacteroidota bacterium]|nr:polyphosphate polymerase domain-containing protein [Bacteroidota bacterium]
MARLEYKYYIPELYLDELRHDILPFLVYDSFTLLRPNKEYTVRSIYLDSPQLHTYQEKLIGTKERHKYRIRGYNEQSDSSIVFLEIKRKDIEFVSKDRAKLLYSDLDKFLDTKDNSLLNCPDNERELHKSAARNFLYYYYLYQLRPAVIVTYEREAFECKFNTGLRVTFDKNIRSRPANSFTTLFGDEGMVASLKNYFVLEIKYHKIVPGWLPKVMSKYNVFRDSASKYMMSIDASYNHNYLNSLNNLYI